jgi:hypothetical protein
MSYSELQKWIAAKEDRKKRVAKGRVVMAPMSDKTAEIKKENAKPDGFHSLVKERDRVCQYCQQFTGKTHRAGKHADHVIRQEIASREEKTDPKYGVGACEEANYLRHKKYYRAAMVKDAGLWFQVIWCPDKGTCFKRSITSEHAGAWFDFEKPEHLSDSNTYEV